MKFSHLMVLVLALMLAMVAFSARGQRPGTSLCPYIKAHQQGATFNRFSCERGLV